MNLQKTLPAKNMQKLWTRSFLIMIIISLAVYTGQYMLSTSLPAYILKIGGNEASAGLVVGIFTLAALVCRPLIGKVLDTTGRRVVMVLGSIILIAAASAYPLVMAIPMLLILRVLHGVGHSAFTTGAGTIIADIVPQTRLTAGISYYGIAGDVATALGPVLGIWLTVNGFNPMFIVLIGIGVISLVGSSLLNYEKKKPIVTEQVKVDHDKEMIQTKGGWFEKAALRTSLVVLIMSLPLDAVMVFMPLFGIERGIVSIALFFPLHTVGMLAAKLTLGRMADRIGANLVFIPSLLLLALSFLMLAFASSDLVVAIASVFFGLGLGMTYTLLNTFLIRLSPPDRLGAANATYMASIDIGFGAGAIILGFFLQIGGFTVFFLAAALIYLIALVVYLLILLPEIKKHRSIRL